MRQDLFARQQEYVQVRDETFKGFVPICMRL